MAMLETTYLSQELRDRHDRLEEAIEAGGESERLARLLREVDEALRRMDAGTYGLCDVCHDPVEIDRLLSDPLLRTCLDHFTADERRALEQDLDLAAQIQRSLLPKQNLTVSGWEAFYHYEPAGAVSGDYCDLVAAERDGGDLFFLLGDVSGKGVAASMLMAGLRATLRTLIGSDPPISRLVERANRLFCESTAASHFATLVCGRASRSGRIEICNAGHCPPVLIHNRVALGIQATGLPIGLFRDAEYQVTTSSLAPGDALLLYTDGLTESRDRSSAEYGTERLNRLMVERHALPPRDLVGACLADLTAFRSGTARTDDLT
ncbi:MAG TPA: SpoIIE family protein phosphatase, partial [Candidatus Polarisedimenticolia bacterium]|nr:SpoIIE family protein phosphatase [Candidatus Polarisedimenticolia bacterium]